MQRIYHASEVHRDVILRTLCCYFLRGLSRLYHCHAPCRLDEVLTWTLWFWYIFSKNGI